MANREEREIIDARAFLLLVKTGLSVEKIAELAGTKASEVERLVALAKGEKK